VTGSAGRHVEDGVHADTPTELPKFAIQRNTYFGTHSYR
jgi:hypothetical protein